MRLYRYDDSQPASGWDRLVSLDPNGHLLQTSGWARLKATSGWRAERWYVEDQIGVICGAQVLFCRRGLLSYAYIPKGPFMTSYQPVALSMLWHKIEHRCRMQLAINCQVEPDLPPDDPQLGWLAEHGFKPSAINVQPLRSVIVDLLVPEEELLARMKQKWRYNIRLSERKGVVVREAGEEGMDAFYELLKITSERDYFAIHERAYYQAAFSCFKPGREVELLLAEYNGQPLAGLIVFCFNGVAYYLYGASSNERRELMVNHLTQWRAMQWAKERDCHSYDLWGVANKESDASDQLASVGQFKSGFGGRTVRYAGAYDKVLFRPAYQLWQRMWQARRQRG
ncbi:MAG: peptidoglycan bridge formation glycyltransferase FemA/FemB family protein [Chloroflexi bacterium]|nr:peptidoglycan bridge formation glycyltransferase FemA/FemB family protein [Chloroflexota bacterium]